jgi:hypothetical protein
MQSISDILKQKGVVADYHNTHEFQAYGNMLAEKFGDPKHRTLYIKLAKEEERRLLEAALAFVMDTDKKFGLGKLFMWKLKELQKERAQKESPADDKKV